MSIRPKRPCGSASRLQAKLNAAPAREINDVGQVCLERSIRCCREHIHSRPGGPRILWRSARGIRSSSRLPRWKKLRCRPQWPGPGFPPSLVRNLKSVMIGPPRLDRERYGARYPLGVPHADEGVRLSQVVDQGHVLDELCGIVAVSSAMRCSTRPCQALCRVGRGQSIAHGIVQMRWMRGASRRQARA